MALIKWSEQFSVGVAEIDNQHKTLINMVNELHDAMSNGKGGDVLPSILKKLADYTQTHFATEERLMVARSYPSYRAHKQVHDSFARDVAELQKKCQSGGALLSIQIMNKLKDWLTNHILNTDKLLGRFLTS